MMRDPVLRMKWEEVLDKFEVVQDGLEGGQDVIYYIVKTPFGVRNRDFVCVRGWSENFEGYDNVGFMTGTVHPDRPPVSGTIRGHIIIGASFFKKVNDTTTTAVIFTKSDPKVNFQKIVSNFNEIRELCRRWSSIEL
jgi:hypothetical protein